MEGVVGGIAFYGNCFGVPTIGGEVVFADCYSQNPLVNAFALGIFEKDKIFYGRAHGVGNPVIYVGAKTGRDGIHGATMASAGFGEDAGAKRPNVQIGDPFMEKLLLEACLEAMQKGLIVGIQDMGAAGLTCSSCEMGARAGTGIELDLDDVPQREARHDGLRNHAERIAGTHAARRREEQGKGSLRGLPQMGTRRRYRRTRHRRRSAARPPARQSRGRDSEQRAGRRSARLPTSDDAAASRRFRRSSIDYSFLDGCERSRRSKRS